MTQDRDDSNEERLRGSRVERMRTRYAPRFRPAGGILGMAPWLDLVLVFVFYLLLETRVTLHPGVVVELPQAPVSDGLRAGDVVLLTMERGVDGKMREVAYVDDLRYVVGSTAAALAEALRTMRGDDAENLVLYADRRVPHETVASLLEMARAAGFLRVGLATQQPPPAPREAAVANGKP